MGGLKKISAGNAHYFFIGLYCLLPAFHHSAVSFSKDEILAAAYESNKIYWVIGVATAAITAFYMFRLYATTFLGKFRGTQDQEHHLHESPACNDIIPLMILAILAVVGGFIGIPEVFMKDSHWLEHFLAPQYFAHLIKYTSNSHVTDPKTEILMLMGVSVTVAFVAMIIAWMKFSKKPDLREAEGFGKSVGQ